MANIIFTSLGSGGDVFPFLRIGAGLKARGHRVTLMSHCCYRDAAASAGLDFAALDGPEEYARFIKDGPFLNTPRGVPEFLRRHSLPKALLQYELLSQRCRLGDTLLITRDLFDTGVRISAEKLRVPLLGVFFAPSQIATAKIRNELFSHALAPEINRLRAQVGLSPVGDWRSWLGYPNRSIALWPEWFAPSDSTWPPGVMPVGFLTDSDMETGEIPDETQAILDNGEAPILITGGTGMYLGSEFYAVSAEACRLLNFRGILVTRYQEQVPTRLPDSVRRFSYLPFGKLMPFLRAIIHHGGRGTLSCAIAAGTPQLVLAMGADRPDNACRLQRLGVAEYLPPPKWQASAVAEMLEQVTNSQAIRVRCADLARRVALTDPLTTACNVIEETIQTNGKMSQ